MRTEHDVSVLVRASAKYQEAGRALRGRPRRVDRSGRSMRSASARQASWTVCTSPTATADVFRISANRFSSTWYCTSQTKWCHSLSFRGADAGGASETSRSGHVRPCDPPVAAFGVRVFLPELPGSPRISETPRRGQVPPPRPRRQDRRLVPLWGDRGERLQDLRRLRNERLQEDPPRGLLHVVVGADIPGSRRKVAAVAEPNPP